MDGPQHKNTATHKKNRKKRSRNKFKNGQQSSDPGRHAAHQGSPVAAHDISKLKTKKQRKELTQQAVKVAVEDGPCTSGRGQALQPAAQFTSKAKGSNVKGSSLLEKMRQRLQGAHFRWLNEKLYTCQGREALHLMKQEPQLYTQYHEGFREQTRVWPVQPVEVAIRWLKQRPVTWAVADLGCGDARLADSVPQQGVRSFDLVATAPGVEACNMAQLPLGDGAMDAVVFCLSLMGTDYGAFVEEAVRVLRPGAWLWIAEVQSRFVDDSGHNMIDEFVAMVKSLGLELKQKDLKNPYFFTLQFQKQQPPQKQLFLKQQQWPVLRACLYKKR